MGRRKKKARKQRNRMQEFYDAVEFTGLILPHQLKQWDRFFLSEGRFLDAAEQWLSLKLQGRHMRIEDDIDKGLMPHVPYIPFTPQQTPAQPRKSWWSRFSDEYDDYHAWGGWGSVAAATPKIAEPSGLSGAMLVAL